MRRTLEAVFRHPIQLLFLIVLLPVVGVAIAYFAIPRTYQATASLWALQRYYVIGATGPETDLTSTPAETQATVLNELLQTHTFTQAVSEGIQLGPTLNLSNDADPQQVELAIYNNLSTHVVATSLAYNLFEISYTSTDPKIAQQVVQSVIALFGNQSLVFSKIEGQNLIVSYEAQLASAEQDLNKAVTAQTEYFHTHPNSTLANDPQFSLLDLQRQQAQTNVTNIQNTINGIQQSMTAQGGANLLFQVIDAPQVADQPVSRTKNYLLAGSAGLAIALLGCVVYLVIAVRRDRGVYTAHEMEDLAPFPIVMQLPALTPGTILHASTDATSSSTLLRDGKGKTRLFG